MQLPKETEDKIIAKYNCYSRVDFGLSGDNTPEYIHIDNCRRAMQDATAEASLTIDLLATLESIKEDCKSKGIPMDLVLQSIYNKAAKAVKGYNQKAKTKI